MAEKGIAAVFGPTSRRTAAIVNSICRNLEIPNIGISSQLVFGKPKRWRINLYPEHKVLAKVLFCLSLLLFSQIISPPCYKKERDPLLKLSGVMVTYSTNIYIVHLSCFLIKISKFNLTF